MVIFKTAQAVSHYLLQQKATGKTIGFVPTMGALHAGHLSLIEASVQQNDLTVCSIFINPTQFNNASDLKHYPVTIEKDIEQLIGASCSVLFLPSENEIYPEGYVAKHYNLGEIEQILEGFYRPGHFQGVCQVVDRLLQIIAPDNLYIGQKDYQQCIVISELVKLTGRGKETRVIIIPTMRETNGLAMSSRNMRLNDTQKQKALQLIEELSFIKENIHTTTINDLQRHAVTALEKKGFQVDYVSIANAESLQPARSKEQPLVALVAATLDGVRLIDNLLLNGGLEKPNR